MKQIKDLKLGDTLYLAEKDKITTKSVIGLLVINETIKVVVDQYTNYMEYPSNTKVGPYHLTLEDAQERQEKLRKEYCSKCYSDLQLYKRIYEDSIDLLNSPLSEV